MENTNTIQFPNDHAVWFVSVGDQYRGPFKAEEIYQKLKTKEVSWIDYLYREQDGEWIRAADHPVFKALQNMAPKPKPVMTPPAPPMKEDTKWFLFQSDTQTGPYSTVEMRRLSQAGQIIEGAFVWQEKFSEWKPYVEINELKENKVSSVKAPPPPVQQSAPADKRANPRKPLVAQVYATNQKTLITGLCRDISIGGMQVLTDHLPGEAGTAIRLNVIPPEEIGIGAFVAEGVVVRILEDRRGFSFRFTHLAEASQMLIRNYIENNDATS